MPKYIVRSRKRSDYEDDREYFSQPFTTIVHEEEKEPFYTGVLDKYGNEYVRMPETNSIGFITWLEKK